MGNRLMRLGRCFAMGPIGFVAACTGPVEHDTPASRPMVGSAWAAPQDAAPPQAPAADPAAYLEPLISELRKTWPKNRTLNLVCHGHSVPAGYFVTPVVDPFNAYPHLWHRALKERFPHAVINVIVTAVGGEASVSGEQRFEDEVLALRPDLITIDYGLNDRRVDLKLVAEAWESMLSQAKAAGVPVILLTPTLDTGTRLADPSDPLNIRAELIRDLARRHGVALVDSLQAFARQIESGTPAEALMATTNHPSRQGHDLVVEGLMEWFPPR